MNILNITRNGTEVLVWSIPNSNISGLVTVVLLLGAISIFVYYDGRQN